MNTRTVGSMVVVALLASVGWVWAEGGHDHGAHDHGQEASAPQEHAGSPVQGTLTGEVVDVTCYLSHPESGIGKSHASCAKKCILNGLPVAIKVDDQLYLAVGSEHEPANAMLAPYAGQRVTVTGELQELDGQHLIVVSHVEKAH